MLQQRASKHSLYKKMQEFYQGVRLLACSMATLDITTSISSPRTRNMIYSTALPPDLAGLISFTDNMPPLKNSMCLSVVLVSHPYSREQLLVSSSVSMFLAYFQTMQSSRTPNQQQQWLQQQHAPLFLSCLIGRRQLWRRRPLPRLSE